MHLFDNIWTFSIKNVEYNYLYVQNYIYKKLKEAVEMDKKQTKNHNVLAKIYKICIIRSPICDAFGNNFFPSLTIIECYKLDRP